MTINLTLEQFSNMIPNNSEEDQWFSFAKDLFEKYGITTDKRIAAFMAQAAYESNDFNKLEENLNYSWQRLRQVFPKYFPTDSAAQKVARQPEAIANIIYNDKYRTSKLGNIYDGDGWKFRGSGIFQLTGRYNYEAFGKTINKTADETAVYIRTKQGAFESALWFWNTKNLDKYADTDDITGMTKIINGGDIGLSERLSFYKRNLNILSENDLKQTSSDFVVLSKGSRGSNVSKIQTALKLYPPDGIFGNDTDAAVKSWQRRNKYVGDGKIDEEQFNKMIGK